MARSRTTVSVSQKIETGATFVLRHIVNLWTLVWHPTQQREWSLERKLRAVKAAGFDGFTTQLTPQHAKLADKLGLTRVGYFSSANPREFRKLLLSQKECGALHSSVQLGDHGRPPTPAYGFIARSNSI